MVLIGWQVAGGDGTVGWILGCLTELHKKGREPVPPVGVIPLGTGNDLSRSFNWVSTYGMHIIVSLWATQWYGRNIVAMWFGDYIFKFLKQ